MLVTLSLTLVSKLKTPLDGFECMAYSIQLYKILQLRATARDRGAGLPISIADTTDFTVARYRARQSCWAQL